MMQEKFDLKEVLRYFSMMESIKEVKLGNYKALYLLQAMKKARSEFFIFDKEDVKALSDEQITELVKSSPMYKTGLSISRGDRQRYVYVRFNRTAYYMRLDMFNKTFLDATKNTKIQRSFQMGKGYNPNPKLYKYIWWVFHKGVQSENLEALTNTNESRFLEFKKVESFIDTLRQKGEPYAYVCKSYPRLGVKEFDYERMKKNDPQIEFAPALEDDEEREEILAIYEIL
jgi:hypothetical protein